MAVKTNVKILADVIYPVGSIYLSVNSTSPSTLFGGTWEQIKDRFLLGCGSTYSNGLTGGEATHKLTIGEMPKHEHGVNNYNAIGSEYSHLPLMAGDSKHSFDGNCFTASTGGDQPHNNMPPYLAVYMWKRTG